MKLSALVLIIILGLFLAFTALNWTTIMTPTTLNLGVAEMNAPLGLVMIGMLALLSALFLIFMLYLQTSVLFESRRHAKELQSNRELADKAEASRFTELRQFMEADIQRQAAIQADARAALLTRLDLLSTDIRSAISESDNSLSAYIGELEDRLESKFPAQK